jgi:hypothetical protein
MTMDEIQPGMHPKFDITRFAVPHQRVLRRLCQMTHLNRDGEVVMGRDTKYRYALIRPTGQMRGLLHTDREVMVIFSDYQEFQSRTLDAFDRLLNSIPDDFRVEKVARILISEDKDVSTKIRKLFESKPDAPVVIPFHVSELTLSTTDSQIASRIREFTYSRDLFSMSSPLRNDLYFYGRSNLINEICSKLASGENFGLFGLRRSGKTSIVNGISRAISTRSGSAIIIDCQSPAVHQRRWNELLFHIVKTAKHNLNSTAVVCSEIKYNEKDAADAFLKDLRAIKSNKKIKFLAILFDEIERIGFGTASSPHWNDDRDFLHFWQAVRYGFQSENSPFSFLIVGTNPSAVERIKIFESDNPLFGNVEKRFIPMFSQEQTSEMVDGLGAIMGIQFDGDCKARLNVDFGGHPFLTRYACSYVSNSSKERPLSVDRTVYQAGVKLFSAESYSYVESIVGLLRDEYPEEFEMLKYLGSGDEESFRYLAEADRRLYEHLIGYGVVARGAKSFYFSIGVVREYFENLSRPSKLLTYEEKISEISSKRNSLERDLRRFIGSAVKFTTAKSQRSDKILSRLTQVRRDAVSKLSFEQLISEGNSPLFLNELKAILCGNWDIFGNAFDMQKPELEYHMDVINRTRVDAHAKDLTDLEFDKWRVSFGELSKAIGDGRS